MSDYLLLVLAIAEILLQIGGSCHVVMQKRDVRSAIGWVAVIWLAPVLGAILYWLFGVNRISRRAKSMLADVTSIDEHPIAEAGPWHTDVEPTLVPLARMVERITRLPLTASNQILSLDGGTVTYNRMLERIREARTSVALCSYIFEKGRIGEKFIEQLSEAVRRGVEVRVLVDGIGVHYRSTGIIRALRNKRVTVAVFNPPLIPRSFRYSNLRNHRKLLVVDGEYSFTGGMNIRNACVPTDDSFALIDDLHFEVNGPVTAQLQSVFCRDWEFATGEILQGPHWFPEIKERNRGSYARVVPDGPDEQLDWLRLTLLGAIDCARSSIKIISPYFLPDWTLISALNVKAMQGVPVSILIPQKSNLKLVDWASTATLPQLLRGGCRIFRTTPPFDHSKLMVVDDSWVFLGSANWDSRSLRLNFELNVEVYDKPLANEMANYFDRKVSRSTEMVLEEFAQMGLPLRIRDGFARLLSPYL